MKNYLCSNLQLGTCGLDSLQTLINNNSRTYNYNFLSYELMYATLIKCLILKLFELYYNIFNIYYSFNIKSNVRIFILHFVFLY